MKQTRGMSTKNTSRSFLLIGRLTITCAFLLLGSVSQAKTVVGANFNKNPETINLELLKRAEVNWVRGSIDILPMKNKIDRKKFVDSVYDEQFRRMQMAQDAGKKTILTLRWDFAHEGIRVPTPGSQLEQELFEKARFVVESLGLRAQIIVVGNEPIVETLSADMQPDPQGKIPVVEFYRRLAKEVDTFLVARSQRTNKQLLIGAFNRLDLSEKRDIPGIQGLLKLANRTKHVDGIDVHVHVPSMRAFEQQLQYARSVLRKGKSLIVTEYSMMWLFKQNQDSPLCKGEREAKYCAKYGLSQSLNERDFLNLMISAPLDEKASREVWSQFFFSRSYLPKDFMLESYKLLKKYGVSVAAYTFDQGNPNDRESLGRAKTYVKGDIPIHFGPIFVPMAVQSEDRVRANMYFYRTFKLLPK